MENKTKKPFAKKIDNADSAPKWINYAAEICRSKYDDNKVYLRVVKNFKALRKNSLQLIKYEDYLNNQVVKGFRTQEQVDQELQDIQDHKKRHIVYVVNVPPQEFKEEDKFKRTTEEGWQNDVMSICESEKKIKYIRVQHDFEVVEGQNLPMKKFRQKVESLKQAGKINDLKYNEMLETAKWLHYDISIPPLDKKKSSAPDEE